MELKTKYKIPYNLILSKRDFIKNEIVTDKNNTEYKVQNVFLADHVQVNTYKDKEIITSNIIHSTYLLYEVEAVFTFQ